MLSVCSEPGCSLLVSSGFCSEHAPKPWAGSDPLNRRIRGGRGQRIRKKVMAKYRWCAWPGCNQLATEADHIVPLSEGGDPGPENMHGLCTDHHTRKTREERGQIGYWDMVLRGDIK